MEKHIGWLLVIAAILFGYLVGLIRDGYYYRESGELYYCDVWKIRGTNEVSPLGPQR